LVDGGGKFRFLKIGFLLFFMLLGRSVSSQVSQASHNTHQCGIIQQQPVTGQARYVDRFGNLYGQADITLPPNAVVDDCGPNSDFQVCFVPVTQNNVTYNFTPDQMATICSVFQYISGLIEVTNGRRAMIEVRFDPLMATRTGGVGTVFFPHNCGLGHSLVHRIWHTDALFPNQTVHGRIDLNPRAVFYAGSGTPNANQLDLYTVVLHELMHVLGFGSQIGLNGQPVKGFYTLWDLNLRRPGGGFMVNNDPAQTPDQCCLDYEFNSADFPNMPDRIWNQNCGDLVFDAEGLPPVNAEYKGQSEGEFMNTLSHLDDNCGDQYVMNFELAEGETRRTLTATEIQILCRLGYNITGDCSASCLVLAVDDGPFMRHNHNGTLNGFPMHLQYQQFLSNDLTVPGTTVEFPANCLNNNLFTFINNPATQTVSIRPINTTIPVGYYEICYSITGCDQKVCDRGIIGVSVSNNNSPNINNLAYSCDPNDCRLICNGDFEEYFPSLEYFSNQAGVPNWFDFSKKLGNGSVDVIIVPNTGNQMVVWGTWPLPLGGEVFCYPLKRPIPPGCTAIIHFESGVRRSRTSGLRILGFNQQPPCFSINLPIGCTANVFNDPLCNGLSSVCIREIPVADLGQPTNNPFYIINSNEPGYPFQQNRGPVFAIDDFPLTPVSFMWTNNSNIPINYVTFDNEIPPAGSVQFSNFIDNLSITLAPECINRLAITPTVQSACIGNQAVIDFELCLTGPVPTPAEVRFTVPLPSLLGISYATGGDFVNGTVTIRNMQPSDCRTVRLILNLPSNLTGVINMEMKANITGACWENNGDNSFDLPVSNCCGLPFSADFTSSVNCNTVTFTSATGGAQALFHAWDFDGDGNIDSNAPNPVHTYTTPGTYVVTHTVRNECRDLRTFTATVTIAGQPSADFTYSSTCRQYTFNAVQNPPGSTHTWNFGDGNTGTGATTTHNYAVNGTYTVTLTVSNGCNTSTSSQVVTAVCEPEFTCPCPGNDALNVDGGEANSNGVLVTETAIHTRSAFTSSHPNIRTLTNTCMALRGTLIIPAGYSLFIEGGVIKMQPGARIIIQNGGQLTLRSINGGTGSTAGIHGCTKMWKSIEVMPGGRLIMNLCTVKDAESIVYISNSAASDLPTSLTFNGNNCYRNHIGITVANSSRAPLQQGDFVSNTFSAQDGGLLPPYNPISSWSAESPYAGLLLSNTVFRVGVQDRPNSKNIFNGLRNGILAGASTLYVYEAEFSNIRGTLPFTQSDPGLRPSGLGIYLNGGTLWASTNLFDGGLRNVRAVHVQGATLRFTRNTINNVGTAIYCRPSTPGTTYIAGNTIRFLNRGIIVNSASPSAIVRIERNPTIEAQPSGSTDVIGIRIDPNVGSPGTLKRIALNNLSMRGIQSGITLESATRWELFSNTITYQPVQRAVGIKLQGAGSHYLNNNTIMGAGTGNNTIGIDVSAGTNNRICCNTADMMNVGFKFTGTCNGTRLRHSQIKTLHTGLLCETGTQISPQSRAENLWFLSDYPGFAAQHKGSFNNVINSKFFVPLPPGTGLWPAPDEIESLAAPDEWFVPFGGTPSSCATDAEFCPISPTIPLVPTLTDDLPPADGNIPPPTTAPGDQSVDAQIAAGTLNDGSFGAAAMQFEGERDLYEKLSLSGSAGTFSAFYAEKKASVIGRLYLADRFRESVATVGADEIQKLQQWEQEIAQYSQSLQQLTTQLEEVPSESAAALIQQQAAAYTALKERFVKQNALLGKLEQQQFSSSLVGQSFNAATQPTSIMAANRKTVNQVYLQTIGTGRYTLTPQESSRLLSVATQCLFTGGDAVVEARSLFNALSSISVIFNNEVLCGIEEGSEERSRPTVAASTTFKALLIPNPARDAVQLIVPEAAQEVNLQVQLLTQTGTLQKRAVVTNGGQITLDGLLPGLYLCRVTLPDNRTQTIKLIVLP
jgi:PKD repeat protein